MLPALALPSSPPAHACLAFPHVPCPVPPLPARACLASPCPAPPRPPSTLMLPLPARAPQSSTKPPSLRMPSLLLLLLYIQVPYFPPPAHPHLPFLFSIQTYSTFRAYSLHSLPQGGEGSCHRPLPTGSAGCAPGPRLQLLLAGPGPQSPVNPHGAAQPRLQLHRGH